MDNKRQTQWSGEDNSNFKHGHAARKTYTYTVWRFMRARCEKPDRPEYRNYGGRGIKVCDRWQSFENFLADMGEKPRGLSLDRIDNNGHYEPGNCRWATTAEQNRNRRNNVFYEMAGEKRTAKEWCEVFKVPYRCVRTRLARGWDQLRAFTEPSKAAK
jgi:hypothetical protein